jgi:hypothetical protein
MLAAIQSELVHGMGMARVNITIPDDLLGPARAAGTSGRIRY